LTLVIVGVKFVPVLMPQKPTVELPPGVMVEFQKRGVTRKELSFVLSTVLEIVAATTSPGLTFAVTPAPVLPVVVDIHYSAPAQCPNEEWFYADVLGRIPRARRAAPGEAARRFDVTVVIETGKSRAALEFVDAEGRRVQRDLEADDCAEVVAGIAVVTALAIDPRLAELDRAAPESSKPPPARERAPREEPPSETPRARRSWSWSLGAHAGAVSDVAPVWVPSIAVFSELLPSDAALTARLALGLADSGELERDGARLRFWLLHGGAELCPFTSDFASRFRLLPCAGIEVGAVHAEGLASPRLAEPSGTTDLWLAATFGPALELDLGGAFFLELQGKLRLPLLRRTYVLERPPAVAYETPALGFGVFLGLGLRLAD
jgi:hypothetical protein